MKGAGLALACGVALTLGAFEACGGAPAADDVVHDGGSDSSSAEDGSKGAVGSDDGGGSGGDAAGDEGGADGDLSDVGAADAEAGVDSALMVDANGPPFGCGTGSLECYQVTEFCSQVTGPHGGVFYDCIAAPAACATDVSCACLADAGISSQCDASDGGIFVVSTEP